MLKRQESSLSSSRRQGGGATPPPPETHHAKAIGCMSGIIKLFSKNQNPKKRLTFGRKQEKCKPPSQTKAKSSESNKDPLASAKETVSGNSLTCDINFPRSPTLPPEIRLSNTANSPENPRTPSSLVARLMGLEDIRAAKRLPASEEDPITEKRQQLLQALEKCNEDLEALKRIIMAVQTADVRLQVEAKRVGSSGRAARPCMKEGADATEEVSPVCVVDELTRSPLISLSRVQNASAAGTMHVSRKQTTTKKPGEYNEPITKLYNKPTTTESLLAMRRRAASSPPWSSRAMVRSVEEACRDIAWGEKREVGRIGLVLQDYLCRDLIEELVNELKSCPMHRSLPLEACKRRLRF